MNRLDLIVLGQFTSDFKAWKNPRNIPYTYRARLDKAAEFYGSLTPTPRIIISGDDTADMAVTEAQFGLNYLLATCREQYPKLRDDVILEEQAQTTLGNAYYTKRILLRGGSRTPIVISSDFHLEKVEGVFRFIYGPDFNPIFVGAHSGFTDKKLARLAAKYKKDLTEMMQAFEELGIKPGEHEKIKPEDLIVFWR